MAHSMKGTLTGQTWLSLWRTNSEQACCQVYPHNHAKSRAKKNILDLWGLPQYKDILRSVPCSQTQNTEQVLKGLQPSNTTEHFRRKLPLTHHHQASFITEGRPVGIHEGLPELLDGNVATVVCIHTLEPREGFWVYARGDIRCWRKDRTRAKRKAQSLIKTQQVPVVTEGHTDSATGLSG